MRKRNWRDLTWAGVLSLVCTSVDAAELEVHLTPTNRDVQQNVVNHIGTLGDQDVEQLQRYARIARAQAEQALQAVGYYQSQIEVEAKEGKGDKPPRLVLDIQAGPPVRLRQIQVQVEGEAAKIKDFQGLGSDLKSGQILNHGQYEDVKQQILTRASQLGFFKGRFKRQQLLIDPETQAADVFLIYDSGPRYHLGAVSFEGDPPVSTGLLQRMVPFKAGTPYDSEHIVALNQALQSSNYFSNVRVDTDPNQADSQQQIPVKVFLTARKPRSLGLGFGFSTDAGPRLRFDWSRYWSNTQGHRYGAEAELSAPRQNVGFWYEVPRDPPLTSKLRYAGGYQYEEIAGTDSRSSLLTLGPEWHQQFESGWQRVLSLKWQREEYRLGNDSGETTLFMPGIAFNYKKSDHAIDPSHGYRLEFKLAAAKDGVLSDMDLLHGEALVKGLTTLWDRHRFLGRVQVGVNLTDDYRNVPPSQRFWAGGDQSVRGYDYQKLSPTNSDDDYVGGRYMVAASAEYQYSIADKWRIAAFVDQGNAFNSPSEPALKTSVGFGLRWVSPVGPIRVDLANPLDGDGGVRFHFSMGPEL